MSVSVRIEEHHQIEYQPLSLATAHRLTIQLSSVPVNPTHVHFVQLDDGSTIDCTIITPGPPQPAVAQCAHCFPGMMRDWNPLDGRLDLRCDCEVLEWTPALEARYPHLLAHLRQWAIMSY